jgi:hypothetical protein
MTTHGLADKRSNDDHQDCDEPCLSSTGSGTEASTVGSAVDSDCETIEAEEGEHTDEGESESEGGGRLKKKILNFNAFIDLTQRGLEPTTSLVWLTLFRFAWNGVVRVDQDKIAAAVGVDTRTVQRHLKLLYSLKLVKKTRHGGNGRGVNWYRLGLQPLPCRPKKNKKKPAPK